MTKLVLDPTERQAILSGAMAVLGETFDAMMAGDPEATARNIQARDDYEAAKNAAELGACGTEYTAEFSDDQGEITEYAAICDGTGGDVCDVCAQAFAIAEAKERGWVLPTYHSDRLGAVTIPGDLDDMPF